MRRLEEEDQRGHSIRCLHEREQPQSFCGRKVARRSRRATRRVEEADCQAWQAAGRDCFPDRVFWGVVHPRRGQQTQCVGPWGFDHFYSPYRSGFHSKQCLTSPPRLSQRRTPASAILASEGGDSERNWTVVEESFGRRSSAELWPGSSPIGFTILLGCQGLHWTHLRASHLGVFEVHPSPGLVPTRNRLGWQHLHWGAVTERRTSSCDRRWPRLASPDPVRMAGMSEDGRSSRPPSEEERLEETLGARDCLVQQVNFVDNDYSLGSLDLVGEEPQNCAVIAIGLCQGKPLVGVPEAVWHRSLSKRRLPPKALSRPVLAAVVACTASKRTEDADIVASTKVWIGLLDPQMEKDVTYLEGMDFDHHFGLIGEELAIPYGKALVEVANEHFGFVTAESELPQKQVGGDEAMEGRMRQLEKSMEAMRESLAAIAGGGRAVPLPARPKPKSSPPPKTLEGMDPTTVQAALQAGVPVHHLEEMSKILRTRPTRLEDVPRRSALKKVGAGAALGETEEEGEEQDPHDDEVELIPDVSGSANLRGDPRMETAIIQLTAIASKLAGGDTKKDKMDQILDGGGGSGNHGDSGPHPMSRKNSVALRALQRCLKDDPKYIYQSIEANLQGDFLGRAASAGEPRVAGTTVRGWLTSKSRIQNYQQHVRWCWALGGVWDALIEGKVEEARARCALMMSAADQASIDGGNCVGDVDSGIARTSPPIPAVRDPHCPQSCRGPTQRVVRFQVGGDLSHSPEGSGLVRRRQEEAEQQRSSQGRDRGGEGSSSSGRRCEGKEQSREGREDEDPTSWRLGGWRSLEYEDDPKHLQAGKMRNHAISQPMPIHIPGSKASVVTGAGTFHHLMRSLFRCGCRLGTFAKSFAAQRQSLIPKSSRSPDPRMREELRSKSLWWRWWSCWTICTLAAPRALQPLWSRNRNWADGNGKEWGDSRVMPKLG